MQLPSLLTVISHVFHMSILIKILSTPGTWKQNGHYLFIDSSLADCKFARQPLVSATLVNTGDFSQYSGYVGMEQPGKFRLD